MTNAAAAEMVERQLIARGIRDPRVLQAMREIPREEFVAEDVREEAYADAPLPIGFGQTITQPYMTALMAEALELRGDENVLDVGTGSGYHAAVLGALARRVISVERIPELCALARSNLRRTGLDSNITVLCGDGSLGVPEQAPFQGISVAAAAPSVPRALLDQLDDPGILVIPVGGRADQDLQVIRKKNGKISTRVVLGCRFVPLIGREGWQEIDE
ncbi:MAG TPA: protein-L-isoaspartate(D-aspartate) O-methyltransferase [Bryobacteraceae bacterium]|jgi:protein-L-isoaspartate(D-aspartate) O-methyltransferase|nr:protein-L-isoaspartate(D-aspartate) O-methyltransferase [Bryobacteraceae bacterium]